MKKLLTFLVAGAFLMPAFAQTNIAIIPEPVSIVKGSGTYPISSGVTMTVPSDKSSTWVAAYLAKKITAASAAGNTKEGTINFVLDNSLAAKFGEEGYRLSVKSTGITVSAAGSAGLFYGVQTLLQLFPKEIESLKPTTTSRWEIPLVEIEDYPRFEWRGLMFDVARHFFTKEDVKRYIDDMVRYKYNILHLHLTDDEGWRIQIKSLPRLTEVGAWNVKKQGYFGTFAAPLANEPRNYGGFYTHEDIKELVQYAAERFVNILPEIDVPGHSLAAIAAYPDLSCTPGANKYVVRSGEPIMDWSKGAPPIALVDNTLCPANEKVYAFLDKVMTEVAALFPFEYIHVGGDEAPHNYWKQSAQVKALMQKEGLKTIEQVQGYFEKRLEKIVLSKGKKFMGWDEIMEGGLAPSAAVMSWRGMKGGAEAAKMGHEVVMSPTTFAYIDYMQADPVIESRIYASLRLNKSYQFEPLPEGVDKKYIKGGQANLWTEQIYNMRQAQYMTWPRGMAIAESVWSPKEKKDFNRFFAKVEQHFERLDLSETKYAPSAYDPIIEVSKGKDSSVSVALSTEVQGLDIYYSFDNSYPDRFYPRYSTPLNVPKEAAQLKIITYKGDKQVGRYNVLSMEEMKKRAGIKK